MTPVSAPDGSNFRSVPRHFQPVVNGRAYLAALDWRIARAGMADHQKQDAFPAGDRPVESTVDRAPCLVEVETMQVEHDVGLDVAGAEPAVPAGIECLSGTRGRWS